MANEEHLAILKQGANVWNKWRAEKFGIMPDLCRADIKGFKLFEVNLSGSNLSEANLSGADLSLADFSKANLREANLWGANLYRANLREANISMAELTSAKFITADLIMANLREANLFEANLTKADLRKSNLSGAHLLRANLSEANLSEADLTGARLWEANLSGADLSGSILFTTSLVNAKCKNTIITGAKTYAWNITDWSIEGIKCDYIFTDIDEIKRLPIDRNFQEGEFEKLYKQLPTIEYYFENGITPIDVVLMDKIVEEIREKKPEFEIEMQSVEKKGLYPCIKFTVKYEQQKEGALELIAKNHVQIIAELKNNKNLFEELVSGFKDSLTILKSRPEVINYNIKPQITDNSQHFQIQGDMTYNEINDYNITVNHLNELKEAIEHNESLPEKIKKGVLDTISALSDYINETDFCTELK